LEPNRLADDVGIPDREAYRGCVDLDEVAPRIEADIAAAGELSITRVPTIIFQGTLLPTPPDSAALFERTQESLKTGS
jgi:predicted DsbA family dithiol-disulfide isomerase